MREKKERRKMACLSENRCPHEHTPQAVVNHDELIQITPRKEGSRC
jgi:hypothetical protein